MRKIDKNIKELQNCYRVRNFRDNYNNIIDDRNWKESGEANTACYYETSLQKPVNSFKVYIALHLFTGFR